MKDIGIIPQIIKIREENIRKIFHDSTNAGKKAKVEKMKLH